MSSLQRSGEISRFGVTMTMASYGILILWHPMAPLLWSEGLCCEQPVSVGNCGMAQMLEKSLLKAAVESDVVGCQTAFFFFFDVRKHRRFFPVLDTAGFSSFLDFFGFPTVFQQLESKNTLNRFPTVDFFLAPVNESCGHGLRTLSQGLQVGVIFSFFFCFVGRKTVFSNVVVLFLFFFHFQMICWVSMFTFSCPFASFWLSDVDKACSICNSRCDVRRYHIVPLGIRYCT